MRTILIAFLLLLVAYGGYSYTHHPEVAAQLIRDFVAFITPPPPSFASDQSANQAAGAISPAIPEPAPPPHKAWTPPAVLPVQPHWTWTTSDGKIYHEVRIIRIDADCVTILHSDGGGRVPISTLSSDMQRYFNYDPVAAEETAREFDQGVAEEKAEEAREGLHSHGTENYSITDDYSSAVAEAKTDKKLLLLHFTGSDWCPVCKMLDQQVLSTQSYQTFASAHFVTVTVDFPRSFALSDDVRAQNNKLQGTYGIVGYPTLLVTDCDGKELGRIVGMSGGGAEEIMADLQEYVRKGELANK